MRFIITSRNKNTADEIRWIARDMPEIEVHLGSFETVPGFDCVATAGNSFGLMDAGMDLAVLKFFGLELQNIIQRRILEDFCGEQPVGTAFIVETGRLDHPYVAHAPTMRVPMNISGTDHVYLATWATLLAVRHHNRRAERKIQTLLCPAFGSGNGRGTWYRGRVPNETSLPTLQATTHCHQSVVRADSSRCHPLWRQNGF